MSATWLLGLMAVNSDVLTFHYLFGILSCLQVSEDRWPSDISLPVINNMLERTVIYLEFSTLKVLVEQFK